MSHADTVTAGARLPWKRVGELRIAWRGAPLALGLLVLAAAFLAGFGEQAHGGTRAVGPAPLLAAASHPAPVPSEAEVKDGSEGGLRELLSQGGGFSFAFRKEEALLSFTKEKRGHTLALRFLGASPEAGLASEKELPGKVMTMTTTAMATMTMTTPKKLPPGLRRPSSPASFLARARRLRRGG